MNNSVKENEEIEIQILPLLKALLSHIKLIIVITILFGIGAFLFTEIFITPTYRTSFTLYVNNRNDNESQTYISSSDLTAAKSLAKTYAEIIKSRFVLTEAGKKAGLDYSYEKLSKMVSATTNGETEIIAVYITSTDPDETVLLADSIAEITRQRIPQIIEGCSMQVVDEPYMPTDKYSPSNMKNTLTGAAIGFILTAAIIVFITILDNRIKSDEELENRFGIAVLGVIPSAESAEKATVYGYDYGRKGGSKNG